MAYEGAALSSFADAFVRGSTMAREGEASARLNELRDLQIQQARRDQAEQQMLPQALLELSKVTGHDVTMALGRAAVPAVPGANLPAGEAAAPEVQEPGGEGAYTPGTPAVPARAPVTEKFHTYQSLASALGPEKMALLLKHPEGQRALAELGVTNEPEIRRRQKLATAQTEIRDLYDEAGRLLDKPDVTPQDLQQALLKRAAAMERYADATDNESAKLQAMGRAESLREKAQEVVGDPLAAEDTKALGQAMKTVMAKQGDPDALLGLLDTLSTMKSKYGRGEAQQIMNRVIQGLDLKAADRDVLEFSKQVGKIMAGNAATGQGSVDLDTAVTQAFREHPETGARVIAKLLTGKEGLGYLNRVVGGGAIPKNVFEAAGETLRRQGIKQSDPAYMDKLMALVREYGKRPSDDRLERQNHIANLYSGLRLAESELSRAERTRDSLRRAFQTGTQEYADASREAQDARRDVTTFKELLAKVEDKKGPVRPPEVPKKSPEALDAERNQKGKTYMREELQKYRKEKKKPDTWVPAAESQDMSIILRRTKERLASEGYSVK